MEGGGSEVAVVRGNLARIEPINDRDHHQVRKQNRSKKWKVSQSIATLEETLQNM